MNKTTLVRSPFVYISQEWLGEFENNSRGIGYKLLMQMVYDGQGIWKRKQGIVSLITIEMRFKHEGLDFNGRGENPMTMKTSYVKEKYMVALAFSS